MPDEEELRALLEPAVAAAGLELVRVRFFPQPAPTLQVMVEDPATRTLDIDGCARLSRILSDVLDAADPIAGEYNLEVSSPGIDRPLTRLKDFRDWAGHLAQFELDAPRELNGQQMKRFKAELAGTDGEDVLAHHPRVGALRIPHEAIREAALVLTDALIAATAHPAPDNDNSGDNLSPEPSLPSDTTGRNP